MLKATYLDSVREDLNKPSPFMEALRKEQAFLYGDFKTDLERQIYGVVEKKNAELRDKISMEFKPDCCSQPAWAYDIDACVMCGTTGAEYYGGSMNAASTDYQMYNYGPVQKANAPLPSFGRLVRVPTHDRDGRINGVRDVTEAEAKQIAKRHRKAARRIEKAIG